MCANYNWRNQTILITEDDPLNYRYLELILTKKTSVNLIWAKNGTDSIHIAKQNENIDLILLDLHLPDIDGIEVLKEVKKFKPSLPVFIQTANTWNDEDKICMQEGADHFFTKPINMDKLLLSIDNTIKEQMFTTSE